jgi:hypothetical protein
MSNDTGITEQGIHGLDEQYTAMIQQKHNKSLQHTYFFFFDTAVPFRT